MHSESTAVLETVPAKARAAPPPLAPTFKMPKIGVGRPVIWQPDPRSDHDRFPAWVTADGDDAISVSILMDGKAALETREGVRHKDDPRWTEDNGAYSGVWSHCQDEIDRQAAFEQLADTIDRQNQVLERLTEAVTEQGKKIALLESVISK